MDMPVVARYLGIQESEIKTEKPDENEKQKVASFVSGVINGNILRKGTWLYKVLVSLPKQISNHPFRNTSVMLPGRIGKLNKTSCKISTLGSKSAKNEKTQLTVRFRPTKNLKMENQVNLYTKYEKLLTFRL